jgi:DNA-binding transcriptional MerR regulator
VSEADDIEPSGLRRPVKSEAAFRTISEVSEDLEIPQHVLRFWESKFSQIKPLKRGGGRRYYRPEDLHLLRRIRDLLYKDGYTIRGVQKLLKEPPRETETADDGERNRTAAPLPPAQLVLGAGLAPVGEAPPETVAAESASQQTLVTLDGATRGALELLLDELEELSSLLSLARQGHHQGR